MVVMAYNDRDEGGVERRSKEEGKRKKKRKRENHVRETVRGR